MDPKFPPLKKDRRITKDDAALRALKHNLGLQQKDKAGNGSSSSSSSSSSAIGNANGAGVGQAGTAAAQGKPGGPKPDIYAILGKHAQQRVALTADAKAKAVQPKKT